MLVEQPCSEELASPSSSPGIAQAGHWRRTAIFLVYALLALPVAARLSGFAVRATYRQPIMFNEGWNAYHAQATAAGEALYAIRPDRMATNYPPLSFHLVGAVGRALGDVNLAGRLLSFVALAWVTLCAAWIVRKISGSNVAAALAALFCAGWFAFFAPAYVGANDPQMIGHALVMTALLLYVLRPESAAFLIGACVLCCAGGFVKPNLFAFPLAISLDLLLRSRRRFALWAVLAAITLAVFTAVTLKMDGPFFLQHLLSPRGYSLARAVLVSTLFFRLFAPAILVCAIWGTWSFRRPHARLLVIALLISLLSGIYFSGGSGVSLNVFFDSVIAMAMIAASAVTEFAELAGSASPREFAVLALLPLAISSALMTAGRNSSVAAAQQLAETGRIFLDDAAYVKSQPGPALCLTLLLCYQAGKPLIFDPFTTGELLDTGRLDTQAVATDFAGKKFSVIQMLDEKHTGFPPSLVAAFDSNYRIERKTAAGVFYVPK